MKAIIDALIEISLYSAAITGAILLFRALFRKRVSPRLNYLVWGLLILRLALPVTVESGFHMESLFPQAPAAGVQAQPGLPERGTAGPHPSAQPQTGAKSAGPQQPAAQQAQTQTQAQKNAAAKPFDPYEAAFALWLGGIAVFAAWMAYGTLRHYRRMKALRVATPDWAHTLCDECRAALGVKREIRLWIVDVAMSPGIALFGRAVLLIPAPMLETPAQLRFALLHELTHFRRRDQLVQASLNVLRTAYWFNPLVHLALFELVSDMETACDADVIALLRPAEKRGYLATILSLFSFETAPQLGLAQFRTRRMAKRRIRGAFMQNTASRGARLAAAALALVLALTCFTTACQPTPQEEVVVNKGGDILDIVESQKPAESGGPGETGSGKKLGDRAFPDHYSYEAKSDNGLLTLTVDAEVVLPASGKLPVAAMEATGFPQEMAKAMVRHLFPNGQPMDYSSSYVMTRADIEAMILNYRCEIETLRESGGESAANMITQYEGFIAALEEQYDSAPEERPPATTTDGTYHADASGILRLGCSAEGYGNLSVTTGDKQWADQIWFFNIASNFTLDGAPGVDESFVPGKEYEGKLSISAAGAIKLAEDFLKACGREDIALADIYITDNHGTGHVDDYYGPASHYAYKLFFVPTVCGTPVAVHRNHGANTNGEYDIPWYPECIEFIVGDDGIYEILWFEPGKVTEIVSEDADIIPFEEAMRRFEANIFQTYGPRCPEAENDYEKNIRLDITIKEIRLGLIRVKRKDAPGQKKGLYVPAYLFYGTAIQSHISQEDAQEYHYYLNSGELFTGPAPVIAINAIDGSVIDVLGSY